MPVIHCNLIRIWYILSVSRLPPSLNNGINVEGTLEPVYQTQLLYEQAQIFDESRRQAMFGDLATNSERADQLLEPIIYPILPHSRALNINLSYRNLLSTIIHLQ